MTVATKMTPEVMPNLVALIRRMGGFDAIPDAMGQSFGMEWSEVDVLALLVRAPGGYTHDARLMDRASHKVCVSLHRSGSDRLVVTQWYPGRGLLCVVFAPPADWSVGPWRMVDAMIDYRRPQIAESGPSLAADCDRLIGKVQREVDTYCMVRRDVFIP
jgi:hypothetical protein